MRAGRSASCMTSSLGRVHEQANRAELFDEGQLPLRKDGAGGRAELAMTGHTFEALTGLSGRRHRCIRRPDRPARRLSQASASRQSRR